MKAQNQIETLMDIDRIKARIKAEIDGMIQVLPACAECEKCRQSKHITHKVTSDILDMQVCLACAMSAVRLQASGDHSQGQITVERIR